MSLINFEGPGANVVGSFGSGSVNMNMDSVLATFERSDGCIVSGSNL